MEDDAPDPPWELTIRRVSNGYIVSGLTDMGCDYATVFSENLSDEPYPAELLCLKETLDNIIDYFNGYGSRHDEWRIKIDFEHGDKWVDKK